MGFQSRELTNFDGLVQVGRGANTPQSSAMEMVNIDHQYRTIRGREPSELIPAGDIPSTAFYCDGISSCVTITSFPSTAIDADTFTFRCYVGGIDRDKLTGLASGTQFCIADASANSTLLLDTPLSGFTIYLEVNGSSNLDLICKFRTATALRTLTQTNVCSADQAFADPQNHVCVEFRAASGGSVNWTS